MPSREAPPIYVYINGQLDSRYKVLSVDRALGGKSLDRCVLAYDLALANERLVNTNLLPAPDTFVLVQVYNGTDYIPMHWGQVSIGEYEIGRDERLTYTSRLEPFHFGGELLVGMEEIEPSGQTITNYDELVFNPRIDNKIDGNEATRFDPDGNYCFFSPESRRTDNSRTLFTMGPADWSLGSAVAYLCQRLNPSGVRGQNQQALIFNPDPQSHVLQAMFNVPLYNHRLRSGVYLPEALDLMLEPYGFTWGVGLTSTAAGNVTAQIELFRRGSGQARNLGLQFPGGTLDRSASNVVALNLQSNIASAINHVWVQTDTHEVEATWELVPAWHEDDDTYIGSQAEANKLALDADEYNDATQPKFKRIGRDWVLNEAGDYIDERGEITTYRDLATEFGHPVEPKRRKFLATLTQAADAVPIGEMHGTTLEFTVDGGTTWEPVAKLTEGHIGEWHILEHECGVRWNGQHILPEVVHYGVTVTSVSYFKLRLTATIKSDTASIQVAERTAHSVQGSETYELIDASHKFHWREIYTGSLYEANVTGGTLNSLATDDRPAALALANELVDAWNMGDVSGRIVIEGLELDTQQGIGFLYNLGDSLYLIEGRGVRMPAGFDAQGQVSRTPQIVGINYDCQRHMQTLTVETFRDPGGTRENKRGIRANA